MRVKINLTLLFILFFSSIVSAQKDEISMSGIISSADDYIDLIENEYGQEIVRMEFDIIRDSKETYRYLTDSYEYGILAFGDDRIEDIDIKVYKFVNDQWSLIEKDEDESAVAFISVEPPFTARYQIEITAYAFTEGNDVGHYGLIIFHP
jgi:hypothetical protein